MNCKSQAFVNYHSLVSYFTYNIFGHGFRVNNGGKNKDNELGDVCWKDKLNVVIVQKIYDQIVEWKWNDSKLWWWRKLDLNGSYMNVIVPKKII
jgi:hypothetical protein